MLRLSPKTGKTVSGLLVSALENDFADNGSMSRKLGPSAVPFKPPCRKGHQEDGHAAFRNRIRAVGTAVAAIRKVYGSVSSIPPILQAIIGKTQNERLL